MLSTWKFFPKGLLLYSDNFLLTDERKLSLGLIPNVFPIFHSNYFHPHGKEQHEDKSMLSFRWLGWLVGLLYFWVLWFLSTGILSNNSPLIMGFLMCGHIRDDKSRLKMYDKCSKTLLCLIFHIYPSTIAPLAMNT